MGLLRKLKELLKRYLNKSSPGPYIIGTDTILRNASVSMRNGKIDSSRCTFGSKSIISGQFVLETAEASIHVGERTFIGGGQFISAKKITIGSDVLISWGCTFIDTNAHSINWQDRRDDVEDWRKGILAEKLGTYKDWSKVNSNEIILHDKCWIGFNCIILKGVEIGEGAVVGAGSVVSTNVPPYTVFAGNPAKFIKDIERSKDMSPNESSK